MTDTFIKDPSAKLDYTVDWTAWLGAGTISSSAWTVPTGITQFSASNSTTAASITLTGGTAGQDYELINQITTAAGLIDQRTIKIMVREK